MRRQQAFEQHRPNDRERQKKRERATLTAVTRRTTNGKHLDETPSQWATSLLDWMSTCWVRKEKKITAVGLEVRLERKRHRLKDGRNRKDTSGMGSRRLCRRDRQEEEEETSVTPREAVGASGLRQHEDSRRPRGRKAMFHLKGGGAAEESNQRARRKHVSASAGVVFVLFGGREAWILKKVLSEIR